MAEVNKKSEKIIGVVLAGGQSTRMNGLDKCFLALGKQNLLNRCIEKSQSQVSRILISSNNPTLQANNSKIEIIPDKAIRNGGPLAGILSAMLWVKEYQPACKFLATFPVDSPFYPDDLVSRLTPELKKQNAQIAIPKYNKQRHWVFGLWSIDLVDSLQNYLVDQQQRKVQNWIKSHTCCEVNFDDYAMDPFFNINTPEDFELAKRLAKDDANN